MKQHEAGGGEELLNIRAVLQTRLEQMQFRLDRCIAMEREDGDSRDYVCSRASLEEKVYALLCEDSGENVTGSISWLGTAILDTKALLEGVNACPEAAVQQVTEFSARWEAHTDAPAWAGKTPTERLCLLLALFDAALEGFEDGFRGQGNSPSVCEAR